MLLVATHTKTLPADRWIHTTGEKRGLVLVREWEVPLWDSNVAAENVPAGVVRLRSCGFIKCLELVRATVLLRFPRGAGWHFHPVRAKTRADDILDSVKEKSPVQLEITPDKGQPKKTKEVEEEFITNPKYHNQLTRKRINFLESLEHTWGRAVQEGVQRRGEKHPYPKHTPKTVDHMSWYIFAGIFRVF